MSCALRLLIGWLWVTGLATGFLYAATPHVVIMLADDMGFGEVQCLNPDRGKIRTPHLDALAATSLVFTDAHSGSSVCTPTRYGLLTGRYAWRTRLQKGVLTGGQSLIARDRLTLAKMLRQRGYETAIIGKWHLGMLYDGQKDAGKDVRLGARVTHGPLDRGGFERFSGFHHSRQMRLWVENDRVTEYVDAVDVLPRLAQEAVKFIHERKEDSPPFFLYVPWNAPHSPVAPSKAWQGRSELNAHADFVMQTDDAFGQVIQALRDTGQFDNTLVICSSDNGTSAPTSKMADLQAQGHFSSGQFRGSKADIWDGGHRVPFLLSWPAVVQQPRRVPTLICLTDVMATIAELVEFTLPEDAGEDSLSFLSVVDTTGGRRSDAASKQSAVRRDVIHHSANGMFAIRQGPWKLVCCPGSGGWSKPTTPQAIKRGEPSVQLYHMDEDLGETKNLREQYPETVTQLRQLLETRITSGRSTLGPQQRNDAEVVIDKWKQ